MIEVDDILGIFQGDLIIKAAIELALEDMRDNEWVIEDVFRSLIENPILKQKYGMKEIARAKEFILNNDIPVYMHHRIDKMEYPCITISMGSSQEDSSLSTLGDASVAVQDYYPNDIGKPIRYIVSPFNPESYDINTGIVTIPNTIDEYKYISKGMMAVDPKTGNAFEILGKVDTNGILIEPGSKLPKGKIAIIPNKALWRARRERAISQQQYNIGCHVHSDPSTLIFLHDVVKYALYRYREGLLEYNNFQLSRLQSTDIAKNALHGSENQYSRWIILAGQVEESWIKTPRRFIEAVSLEDSDSIDGAGIKILSNKNTDPSQIDEEEGELWVTIKE